MSNTHTITCQCFPRLNKSPKLWLSLNRRRQTASNQNALLPRLQKYARMLGVLSKETKKFSQVKPRKEPNLEVSTDACWRAVWKWQTVISLCSGKSERHPKKLNALIRTILPLFCHPKTRYWTLEPAARTGSDRQLFCRAFSRRDLTHSLLWNAAAPCRASRTCQII